MSKKGIEDLKKEYEEIRMSQHQVDAFKQSIERAKKDNHRIKRMRVWKMAGTAVAAVFIAFIILPNTSEGVAHAMAKIPLLGNVVQVVTFRDYGYESETQIAENSVPKLETAEVTEEEGAAAYDGEMDEGSPTAFVLEESVDEINYEIEELTTAESRALADLFVEGADYITPISEEIKRQMQVQMAEDENKHYWLDEEIEDWNFKEITPDTQFYINESGNLVISYDEGEVAPMYMGVVTFEIPAEVLAEIYK